jgi:hypothetical protein
LSRPSWLDRPPSPVDNDIDKQNTLADLNAETFRAENRDRDDWESFMRGLFADGFVLRRAGIAKPDERPTK